MEKQHDYEDKFKHGQTSKAVKQESKASKRRNKLAQLGDVFLPQEGYMIDFHFSSDHLYGLPERSLKFELEDTWDKGYPYRLYSLDVFPHKEWD